MAVVVGGLFYHTVMGCSDVLVTCLFVLLFHISLTILQTDIKMVKDVCIKL